MRLLVGLAFVMVLAGSAGALAQECQKSKISCSEAKLQNLAYCDSQRRVDSGMTKDGCLKSGEQAMRQCLQTGTWKTGRRNLCELKRE